jgi:hypothetical protein
MSIDHFHFCAEGETPVEISPQEAETKLSEEVHTIYEMAGGIEHLYIFENGKTAAAIFERWRREPVERIVLTLDGVPQDWARRLPVGTKPFIIKTRTDKDSTAIISPSDGCDMDVSWDGLYDTDGDPNGPARWPVLCGQPVAGEWRGRKLCQKHLDGCEEI